MSKSILLICPRFNRTERYIIDFLKERGWVVAYIEDDYFVNNYPYVAKIFPFVLRALRNLYFFIFLKKLNYNKYDTVLVIKGGEVTISFLRSLRKQNRDAKYICYLWDSIKNSPHSEEFLRLFDEIFSFDHEDCERYGFKFRPMFFSDQAVSRCRDKKKNNSVFFLGSHHSGRYEMLQKIKANMQEPYVASFHVFTSYMRFVIERYILLRDRSDGVIQFFFRRKLHHRVLEDMASSVAVLDLNSVGQSGLTQRAFDCLGLGVKLITNNNKIKSYDFFCESNIFIFNDSSEFSQLNDFLAGVYVPIDPSIVSRYSIGGWLAEVIGD